MLKAEGLEFSLRAGSLVLSQPRVAELELQLDAEQAELVRGALKYLKPPGSAISEDSKSFQARATLDGTRLTIRKLDVLLTLDLSQIATMFGGVDALRAAFLPLQQPAQTEASALYDDYLFQRSRGFIAASIGDYLRARTVNRSLLIRALETLEHQGRIDAERVGQILSDFPLDKLEKGLLRIRALWQIRLDLELAKASSSNLLLHSYDSFQLSSEQATPMALKSAYARRVDPGGFPSIEVEAKLDAFTFTQVIFARVSAALSGPEELAVNAIFDQAVDKVERIICDTDSDEALSWKVIQPIASETRYSVRDILEEARGDGPALRAMASLVCQIRDPREILIHAKSNMLDPFAGGAPSSVESVVSRYQDETIQRLEACLRDFEISGQQVSPDCCLTADVLPEAPDILYERAIDERRLEDPQLQAMIVDGLRSEANGDLDRAIDDAKSRSDQSRQRLTAFRNMGLDDSPIAAKEAQNLAIRLYYLRVLQKHARS